MADYISREAANTIIAEACSECMDACAEFDGFVPDCDECMGNGVKMKIATIPAADVRPVVRSRWIEIDDYVLCANCGTAEHGPNRNFCPNCGADMREQGAEGGA